MNYILVFCIVAFLKRDNLFIGTRRHRLAFWVTLVLCLHTLMSRIVEVNDNYGCVDKNVASMMFDERAVVCLN